MLKVPSITEAEAAGLCKSCLAYKPDQPLPRRGGCHATVSMDIGSCCGKKNADKLFHEANQKRWSVWNPDKEEVK